jgi:hypothetical protein
LLRRRTAKFIAAADKKDATHNCCLTVRLSDAGLRRRQAKLIYPDHRPTPWLTEDAAP